MPPLPDATVTIRDGSLGIVPTSTASTQMKLGVAAIGFVNTIYSVSDPTALTKAIGNTGPLAESAAQLLVSAGGPVMVVPVNPSTYGTASATVKFGTGAETLVVAAKPAVQILAKCTLGGALGVSTWAYSVDGGVTYSSSSVSAATVMVPNATLTTLAHGAGTAVIGDIWTITTAGGAYLTGTGTNTISLSSASPVDAYNGVVTITTGGALGTMAFTYSLDGGVSIVGPILSTGGGTYVIPDSGLQLTFTGGSTAGDYFTFTSTAASYSSADLSAAWNAVITDSRTFGLFHVVGAPASVGAAATLLASVDSLASTAATNYRYCRGFLEVPADTDANTLSAFAASSSTRVAACASTAYTAGALKPWVLPRSSAWHASARASSVPISQDLGRVATGPVKQIPGSLPTAVGLTTGQKPLTRDEQVTPGLDAGRFITLRSILGLNGFFITNPNLMAPVGSDFKWLQYGRVMDVAANALRTASLGFLNDSVFTNADGTIKEQSARIIEQVCDSAVRNALAPGNISGLQITVSRTQNVTSTSTVAITLRIQPLGYAKYISLDIGFRNPNLGN
jgi:hypothetical protein